MSKPAERQVKRAIRALERAWVDLEDLSMDDPRDGVTRLRTDIREYLEYLERATWWRKEAA